MLKIKGLKKKDWLAFWREKGWLQRGGDLLGLENMEGDG